MEQFQIEAVQYGLQYDASDATEAMNYATPYPGGGAPTYVSYQKSNIFVTHRLQLQKYYFRWCGY